MRLALLNRRLTISMSLTALVAFAGGAGFEPLSAILAGAALILGLKWQPDARLSEKMERVWLPLAFILVLRALFHVFVVRDDVVIPVVDLLLLLMCAEALRSLDAPNDVRLYALSFALLLASTAYRPGLLFALAFVSYVAIANVTLMTGHLRRQTEGVGGEEILLGRRFLFGMAGLSGVVLLVAGVMFVAFPRISRGWASRGDVLATSIAGFSDEVSIGTHGSRIYPNPEIVLRVEFPEGQPTDMNALYWRGRSYDRFDGTRWSRSPRLPAALAPTAWYERWGSERTLQRIFGAPLDVQILFALHPVLSIEPDSPRIATLFDNAGDQIYWGSGQPVYDALSVTSRPAAEDLRSATGRFRPARSFYTQTPDLTDRVRELALELTQTEETTYDKAVALEAYFQNGFEYTLELPRTAREATLDAFLFERRAGHCEYFSTAMAVLLRSQGILAREVNGFRGGQWSEFGQYLAVTQNEAHSWVEVWFPGYGWVPFDPTPSGSGSVTALQSWNWPGRLWFDGLQHRWNKWVLDYNTESQGTLFSRIQDFFSPAPEEQLASDTPGQDASRRPFIWFSLFGVVGLLGLLWTNIGGGHSPETRNYLRLRAAYESAGLPTRNDLTPADLLTALRTRLHPAHAAAKRLVTLYLRSRFGGVDLTEEERRDMTRSLRIARRAIRREK
jgi:protein-glutamine gamma-glutamyltransferase